MRILPPPGPHFLTPMASSTEPNSSSSGRFLSAPLGPPLLQALATHTLLHLPTGLATSIVHVLGFIDVQSQGIHPNIGKTGIDICLTDNRLPSRRVLTIYWCWFKCPLLGTRHARDWVDQRHLVRNLWESREPSKSY